MAGAGQYGPYGDKTKTPFLLNFQLGRSERISKIHVESGSITDALGFEITDRAGNIKTLWTDGTTTGAELNRNWKSADHESRTIVMQNQEEVLRISGHEGDYGDVGRHIVDLVIHTNLAPNGYGPFGIRAQTTNVQPFSSPAPSSTTSVIGFVGYQTTGASLQNIGIILG